MRIIALALILFAVIGYQTWDRAQVAADLQGAKTELESLRVEQGMKAEQVDHAAKSAEQAKSELAAIKARDEDIAKRGKATVDELRGHVDGIIKQRDKLAADNKQLTADLAAAKKEAADAAKLALKAEHESCPPPTTEEAVAGEATELAPRVQRPNGEKAWPEDYEWCKANARRLNRPMLTVFVTTSCVHCQTIDNDVLPDAKVGKELFTRYIPCWVMVKNRKSDNYQLAEALGVNEFKYPAIVMEYPDGKRLSPFRPSKDPEGFLKQVSTKRAELEP